MTAKDKTYMQDRICPILSNKHDGVGHVHCLGARCAWAYHCFPVYSANTLTGDIRVLHCDIEKAKEITEASKVEIAIRRTE